MRAKKNGPDGRLLKRSELAAAAGLNPETLRYYEAKGILPDVRRDASGYRTYGAEDLARLSFVRKAKACGFTLDEIRGILRLFEREDCDPGTDRRLIEAKRADLEAKRAEIERMLAVLDAVDRLLSGGACPGRDELASLIDAP